MKLALVIVACVILSIAWVVLVVILLGDLGWCIENFASGDIGHCMTYENSVFGQYIQS